jgi:hypothetical protein
MNSSTEAHLEDSCHCQSFCNGNRQVSWSRGTREQLTQSHHLPNLLCKGDWTNTRWSPSLGACIHMLVWVWSMWYIRVLCSFECWPKVRDDRMCSCTVNLITILEQWIFSDKQVHSEFQESRYLGTNSKTMSPRVSRYQAVSVPGTGECSMNAGRGLHSEALPASQRMGLGPWVALMGDEV